MPPPPQQPPPLFTVLEVPSVDFTVDVEISPARQVATITSNEASVLILSNLEIPGLTFATVGNPVSGATISGTPTVPAQTRLILTYVRNDGSSLVLGSSSHVINVQDPALLFDAGESANYSGTVGTYVDVVLCEPSIAIPLYSVVAVPNLILPCEPKTVGSTTSQRLDEWTWEQGESSSSGQLRLRGTPTALAQGQWTLQVEYRSASGFPQRVLGTSEHSVSFTAPYVPPPPPPPPAPPPPAPPPAPAPSPPPAPAPPPVPPGDPLIANVLLLSRFDPANQVTIANSGAFNGWTSAIGPSLIGPAVIGSSAERQTALISAGSSLACNATEAMGGASGPLTVECFVQIDGSTNLWGSGGDSRFAPLVSLINPGDKLVWTLGFRSFRNASGRVVVLTLLRVMPFAPQDTWNVISPSFGASIPQNLPRLLHAAAAWGATGSISMGAWWNGGSQDYAQQANAGVPHVQGAILRLGGDCPLKGTPLSNHKIVQLTAQIDELRITSAARYSVSGTTTVTISETARNTPFPNY